MTAAPLPPRLRLGGAADIESGLEHRLDIRSQLQSQELVRLRRQRLVERIHALGPRVLFEFIDELDREHALGADLDRRLERYAGLNPAILRAVGGDKFAPAPIYIVGGSP
jgi:hypothetical protein